MAEKTTKTDKKSSIKDIKPKQDPKGGNAIPSPYPGKPPWPPIQK